MVIGSVLIVEDDVLLTRMYRKKLEKDGYEVFDAANGEEGLEIAKKKKPNIILLDIMMPVMNGLQMLQSLKTDDSIKNIPVVVLTNVGRGETDITKGLEMGAVAYLIKSKITPAQVVAKVKEILSASTADKK